MNKKAEKFLNNSNNHIFWYFGIFLVAISGLLAAAIYLGLTYTTVLDQPGLYFSSTQRGGIMYNTGYDFYGAYEFLRDSLFVIGLLFISIGIVQSRKNSKL